MTLRPLLIVLFSCLLIFSSCLRKNQISGNDFIEKEVFIEVLVDIHLVDGITNDRKFYRRFSGVDSVDMLSPILDKYGISRQKFDTTMYIYSRYPALYDEVYNEVLSKLNLMLDENDQDVEEDFEDHL
jgi:hypothetical protein